MFSIKFSLAISNIFLSVSAWNFDDVCHASPSTSSPMQLSKHLKVQEVLHIIPMLSHSHLFLHWTDSWKLMHKCPHFRCWTHLSSPNHYLSVKQHLKVCSALLQQSLFVFYLILSIVAFLQWIILAWTPPWNVVLIFVPQNFQMTFILSFHAFLLQVNFWGVLELIFTAKSIIPKSLTQCAVSCTLLLAALLPKSGIDCFRWPSNDSDCVKRKLHQSFPQFLSTLSNSSLHGSLSASACNTSSFELKIKIIRFSLLHNSDSSIGPSQPHFY